MRNQFVVEILETLFPLAIAAAVGVCAATLGAQLTKERAALDAVVARQDRGVPFPQLTPGPAIGAGDVAS
jgi:hypothetical protein